KTVLAIPFVYLLQGHARSHVITLGELDGLAGLPTAAAVEEDAEFAAVGTGANQGVAAAVGTEHGPVAEVLQHTSQYPSIAGIDISALGQGGMHEAAGKDASQHLARESLAYGHRVLLF